MLHPLARMFLIASCTAPFAAAQNPQWRVFPTTPDPVAAAWDARLQRVVMVGTEGGQRMWEWDGAQALLRPLDVRAEPVIHHLFFDAAARQLVGLSSTIASVGSWDGGLWRWSTSAGAPNLTNACATFDSFRRRVLAMPPSGNHVLFEWDGSQWWQTAPPSGPANRPGAAFAYDPVHRRAVLYGGLDFMTVLGDAWAFDGSVWTALGNPPPGPRQAAALAFDPSGSRLLLYGGHDTDTTTWELRGTVWTVLPTARNPGPRIGARLTFDGSGMLLTGGNPDGASLGHRFTGSDWVPVGHFGVPLRRHAPISVAQDKLRQQWVVFGGEGPGQMGNGVVLFDTQWRGTSPAHVPVERSGGRVVWSPVDGGVLLWGGYDPQATFRAETWLWNGSDWLQRPAAQAPSPRWEFAFLEDPSGGVSMLGGQFAPTQTETNEHWRWDGNTWQQLTPAFRPQVWRGFYGFDEARRRIVLAVRTATQPLTFDVWEWDGSNWTQQSTTIAGNVFVWAPSGALPYVPNAGGLVLWAYPTPQLWTGSAWVPWSSAWSSSGTILPEPRGNRLLSLGLGYPELQISVSTARPAALATVGYGCARNAAPSLTAVQEPRLGQNDFALLASTRAGNAPVLLVLGLATQSLPLGGGCALLVDQPVASLFGMAAASGEFRHALLIPNATGFAGLVLHAQAAVVDPPASTLGTITLTAGLRITIGD
ncbi:MAG: hypothetical protein FJ265_21245 [Planctomycetes bacterium]|nr:hypothetical protein [Planctomycetota bacterium]